MSDSTNRPNRVAIVGMIAVGMGLAVSSFSIVRAEHVNPDKSKTYTCSSGTACVEGNSSGSSTWGVYGVGAIADGVHGVTSSTNGNSGASGISTGTSGSAHGVYGRSSNGQGVYGTSSSDNGVEGHSTGAAPPASPVSSVERRRAAGMACMQNRPTRRTSMRRSRRRPTARTRTSLKVITPRPTVFARSTTTRHWHARAALLSRTCVLGIGTLMVNMFSRTRQSRRRQLSKMSEPREWTTESQT